MDKWNGQWVRGARAFAATCLLLSGCSTSSEVGVASAPLTLSVNSLEDGVDVNPGDGVCYAPNGTCTLRAALMEANATAGLHDISLGAGVYLITLPPTAADPEGGDLDILSNVTIRGAGASRTRIVAQSGDRVFHVQLCELAVFEDLSIEGGATRDEGGGLYNESTCTVRMTNVRVAENSAARGGGLANYEEGRLELDHVDLRANDASERGGAIESAGRLSMTRSTVADNTSPRGVAGAYLAGDAQIDRSTFNGNVANDFGRDPAGALTIAGRGTLTNVTISDNYGFPGGVYVTGRAALTHVTIADNRIGIRNCDACGATTLVSASIVSDPAYPACAGTVKSGGYNIDSADTCFFREAGDLPNTDPMLHDLASDLGPTQVRPLDGGSPAYEMVGKVFSTIDQRGVPRPAERADAGAYEIMEDRFCVNSLGDEVDMRPGDGRCMTERETCTLRAAVMETNALAGPDGVSFCVTGIIALTTRGAGEDGAETGDLDILDDLAIHGAGTRNTIINARSADRVFDIAPSGEVIGAVVTDLSVDQGAVQDGVGGGLRVYHRASLRMADARVLRCRASLALPLGVMGAGIGSIGSLDLDHVSLEKNAAAGLASQGGGVSSTGLVRIRSSRLYANRTDGTGGGLYTDGFAALFEVRLEDNGALEGGGAIVNRHALSAFDTTMSRNTATMYGGAVWVPELLPAASTLLERVTLDENATQRTVAAGAAVHASGDIDIVNATVSSNYGGPALLMYHDATLTNVTLAGNDGGVEGRRIEAVNTIFGATSGLHPVCGAPVLSLGHNIDEGRSCGLSDPTDQSSTDPLLMSLANNGGPTLTREIMWDSPAVDRGDASACPTTDQRGEVRVGTCDIGAYEAGYNPFP